MKPLVANTWTIDREDVVWNALATGLKPVDVLHEINDMPGRAVDLQAVRRKFSHCRSILAAETPKELRPTIAFYLPVKKVQNVVRIQARPVRNKSKPRARITFETGFSMLGEALR